MIINSLTHECIAIEQSVIETIQKTSVKEKTLIKRDIFLVAKRNTCYHSIWQVYSQGTFQLEVLYFVSPLKSYSFSKHWFTYTSEYFKIYLLHISFYWCHLPPWNACDETQKTFKLFIFNIVKSSDATDGWNSIEKNLWA